MINRRNECGSWKPNQRCTSPLRVHFFLCLPWTVRLQTRGRISFPALSQLQSLLSIDKTINAVTPKVSARRDGRKKKELIASTAYLLLSDVHRIFTDYIQRVCYDEQQAFSLSPYSAIKCVFFFSPCLSHILTMDDLVLWKRCKERCKRFEEDEIQMKSPSVLFKAAMYAIKTH